MTMVWSPDYLGSPGKVVLSNPLTCTNTPKGENKLYSDAKGVVPSLDLRFAEGKNLNDYMTGQQLIQFSRSSIGTYVDENGIIQTATADTPRFDHDPTTGESLGLLIEGSRTNFIANSTDLTGWESLIAGDGVLPIATNVTDTAPDGSTSVTKVTLSRATASTSNYSIYRDLATHTNTLTVGTLYIKAFSANDVGKIVDVYNNQGSNQDFKTVTLTNEWQRIDSAGTVSTTSSYLTVALYNANVSTGTVNMLIWGAQVEAGAFPTSYIPTSGTALTRNADVASITGSNFSSWCNQSEGTVFVKGATNDIDGNTGWVSFYQASSPNNNRISVRQVPTIITSAGTSITLSAFSNPTPKEIQKISTAYKNDDFALYSTYSTPVFLSTGLVPVSVDTVLLGGVESTGGAFNLNGTISRLTYFPDRLPDATLQAITA